MTVDVPTSPTRLSEERLESWKEIARYLKRDESTVQRWEKREGMPVHRHRHDKRGSVYAFPAELDEWWQNRRQSLEQQKPNGPDSLQGAVAQPSEPVGMAGRRRAVRWLEAAAILVLLAASVLAWRGLPGAGRSPADRNTSLVRLTSTSGVNVDPALSPDGSLLAYASDRAGSGDLDIWVQPTAGETPTRVTSDPGDEAEPSFSPDGASIVYIKAETGGIYVVGSLGGEPRLLVSVARARMPRFSPDGRWVAFWTGLPPWIITGAPGGLGALFVVPAAGGAPRPLAAEFANARYGVWAPGGESILFLGERGPETGDGSLDWYVARLQGGTSVRTGALAALRRAGVRGTPLPGAWNADGVVTFATFDESASNVWQLPVSPSTGQVAGVPLRLTLGTAIERSPAIAAPDRIAFTSIVENVDIWRVALDDTTGLARGPMERVTDNASADRMMNLSRDGRAAAIISSRTGRPEVWVKDVLTGRERQITHSGASRARLSPDGTIIAAVRGATGSAGTDLFPVAGGQEAVLCNDCFPSDWSPDGSRVLISRGSPVRLVERLLDSGRETELAAHPTWNLFQGRFSPDGRWVVFHTTNTTNLRQIYAVPASVTGPVPFEQWIPVVTDFGMQPSWSADGRGIYHFSLRDGIFCAWLQPVDPETMRPVGEPRAVRHLHEPRLRAAAGAAVTNHVASGFLYMTLTETSSNIWMIRK